jgi:hypothetical protein
MKAALTTEGKTTTHFALSRRSWGISSGTFRISEITVPAFSTRSTSFLSSAANSEVVEAKKSAATRDTRVFFI